MPNSRQTSVIASPSNSRPTNRRRSSMTEQSFHGINTSRPKAKSVTHVSGTICHLCLRPLRGPYRAHGLRFIPETWVTLPPRRCFRGVKKILAPSALAQSGRLAQRLVDARLPAGPGGAIVVEHVGIEAEAGRPLRGIRLRTAPA